MSLYSESANRSLLGLETEYATLCPNRGQQGRERQRSKANAEILGIVGSMVPSLPDSRGGAGFFVSNGGNFYIDQGNHLEYATPECASPRELVIWEKAGERLLAEATRRIAPRTGRLHMIKNNTDYNFPVESTYGCHENYLIQDDGGLERVARQLLPFLVTRQFFAGSGRIAVRTNGVRFELSQRAPFLVNVMGENTTSSRSLINTRSESLCGEGFRRLHLILGDSLMSQLGTFLKVGTTALVLLMIRAGVDFDSEVALSGSLDAFRQTSASIWGDVELHLAHGGTATPLELQEYYLNKAQAFLRENEGPPWAPSVLNRWRWALDAVKRRDLEALASTLDAYCKLLLHNSFLRSRGLCWEELRAALPGDILRNLTAEGKLEEEDGDEDDLSPVLRLRRQLFRLELTGSYGARVAAGGEASAALLRMLELDVRYHDIDQQSGLYYQLARSGYMQDAVATDVEIREAMERAPLGTRAQLRGQVVCTAKKRQKSVAWWDCVVDESKGVVLDLRDPFCSEEQWVKPRSKD